MRSWVGCKAEKKNSQRERRREKRWEWARGWLILVCFGESANISWHVCSASISFRLCTAIFLILCFFFFFFFPFISLFYFDKCFEKSLVILKLCQAGFFYPPLFFYYHRGFTSVRRRFGDERDGIIPIPAPPLSRSNSLTKLSDSILAPTARVNLLCHLQSTRGSAKSRSCPCQNPPTAPLFTSIEVYFLPFSLSLQSVCLSVCLLISLALFSSLCLSVSVVYLSIISLVKTLPSAVKGVYSQHETYALTNSQVALVYKQFWSWYCLFLSYFHGLCICLTNHPLFLIHPVRLQT